MSKIKAAIFDLDGVITQTATLHARAWKEMFDDYNERRKSNGKEPYQPFSIEADYPEHLDGMPRYDGVAHFLKNRGVELSWGNENDNPEKETICGLGNWKNRRYQELIKNEKIEYFEDNVSQIRKWKSQGIKIAVISASKNCKQILEATGLEDLFEVRIDGVISAERNLKGKPAPDIFIEAAQDLNVDPSEALIVEDSRAGVKAGKEGGFSRVIGIASPDKQQKMKESGATEVVESLQEVALEQSSAQNHELLPSAMDCFDKIAARLKQNSGILCLDYDGTLSPIVEDYNKAVISPDMRNEVKRVVAKVPVAMISGRDITYIKQNVNLEGIYYAGSHGFEIEGPEDYHYELKEAEQILPVFDELEKQLEDALKELPGVKIERKKYAIAVHYRNADEQDVPAVQDIVDEVLFKNDQLSKGRGKKIIEIKPNIEWHKGKAVAMLSEKIGGKEGADAVVYIGDDVTDEDAFRSIQNGAGILVGSHDEPTAAGFRLKDVNEVQQFLKRLADHLES